MKKETERMAAAVSIIAVQTQTAEWDPAFERLRRAYFGLRPLAEVVQFLMDTPEYTSIGVQDKICSAFLGLPVHAPPTAYSRAFVKEYCKRVENFEGQANELGDHLASHAVQLFTAQSSRGTTKAWEYKRFYFVQ